MLCVVIGRYCGPTGNQTRRRNRATALYPCVIACGLVVAEREGVLWYPATLWLLLITILILTFVDLLHTTFPRATAYPVPRVHRGAKVLDQGSFHTLSHDTPLLHTIELQFVDMAPVMGPFEYGNVAVTLSSADPLRAPLSVVHWHGLPVLWHAIETEVGPLLEIA